MHELATLPDWAPLVRLAVNSMPSPASRLSYEKRLRAYLVWWDKNGRPAFGRQAVQAYRNYLLESRVSASTVNLSLAALRKLAAEAAEAGILGDRAAYGVAGIRGERTEKRKLGRWLTVEECRKLLARPGDDLIGRRDSALLALLLGAGLRLSEAVGVEVGQFSGGILRDLRGKGRKLRSIALPPPVADALTRYLRLVDHREGPLLRSVGGAILTAGQAWRIVRWYGEACGLTVSPHDLRRTCAELCSAGGAPLDSTQRLLGHSSVVTTEKYLADGKDLVNPAWKYSLLWK